MAFDLCQQNNNMEKDVSHFPDQDTIRHDVAHALFRSKLDMSKAYEQIRMRKEDIPKMAFATIFSTFISQSGDAAGGLQCTINLPKVDDLLTAVFQEYIALFIHVYLDDIFIFSSTIGEH